MRMRRPARLPRSASVQTYPWRGVGQMSAASGAVLGLCLPSSPSTPHPPPLPLPPPHPPAPPPRPPRPPRPRDPHAHQRPSAPRRPHPTTHTTHIVHPSPPPLCSPPGDFLAGRPTDTSTARPPTDRPPTDRPAEPCAASPPRIAASKQAIEDYAAMKQPQIDEIARLDGVIIERQEILQKRCLRPPPRAARGAGGV